jgi:ribosomal protein S9
MTKLKKYFSDILLISIIILMSAIIGGCDKSDDEINSKDSQTKNIENSIWLCPMPMDIEKNRVILSDYISVLTHPEEFYPNVFKNTKVLKLYIEALNRFTNEEILSLVEFTNKNELEVAVEVGGIRMKAGQVPNAEIGIKSAQFEMKSLNKFIDAGGKIDYITTDHSMAYYLTGRSDDLDELSNEEIMGQMMKYFKYIQERIPELKVGTIESLGFFWVLGDRQYEATDKSLKRLDFESFIDAYASVAEQHDVVLDHFHIDFGLHDVEFDGDYGRIFAVEKYLKSKNINSGFIAANAFHAGMQVPADDTQSASISASERTIKYFEDYIKKGGSSDYLILQRWQPYPTLMGEANKPYTQMGVFNSIVSSNFFPDTKRN